MSRFAGLSPENGHRGRCGRYFPGLYLWAPDRSTCMLLPERCRCTWQAIAFILTRTLGDVPPTAAYGSTSPTTLSMLLWLAARRFPTTPVARSLNLRR